MAAKRHEGGGALSLPACPNMLASLTRYITGREYYLPREVAVG
jgi:hypothetical protein